MQHKSLRQMSRNERIEYLQSLSERLQRKQQREQEYLTRRARRGTRTPTDEAYEQDQILENELLAILAELVTLDETRGDQKLKA